MNTPPKELNEQQKQSLYNEHEIWLKHPITTQFLRALDSYEKATVNALVQDLSPSNQSAVYHHGNTLKAARDIRKIVTDPLIFVARSTQQ